MHEPDAEDHDRGLAHDLATMSTQLLARRRALAWLASAGATALVAGCGGGSGGSASSAGSTDSSSTGSTSSTSSSTSSGGTTTTTSGACIADPAETAGPYPADGTNTASGATSNILPYSGIVRSDVRPSFISSTTVAQGVQLVFTITLVDVNNACAALPGYAIYFWHCDRDGNYSLYSAPAESYLRGVQVTDGNGQVTFTTIFPGCYSGRYPHIHFEVYSSLAAATSGRNAKLTSQFAMPADICTTVFNNATGYSKSVANFAAVSLANDNVFGDNSSAQIAAQTPAATGTISAGYVATATVGIAI